jgi:haloacetate dehalogenase
VVADALGGWGSSMDAFSPDVCQAYVNALRDPARVHAICEEYRAAATVDYDHDREDRQAGRQVICPALVLRSRGGPVDAWYAGAGGSLELWRQWARRVQGKAMEGGHFFPEEIPEQTAGEFARFFAR